MGQFEKCMRKLAEGMSKMEKEAYVEEGLLEKLEELGELCGEEMPGLQGILELFE